AALLRRAVVAEELLLAAPDGRVREREPARAAEDSVQVVGQEARHGEVLRPFRNAGRPAAAGNRQADLGDLDREVDRDLRTVALEDKGGAGEGGKAVRLNQYQSRVAQVEGMTGAERPSPAPRAGCVLPGMFRPPAIACLAAALALAGCRGASP